VPGRGGDAPVDPAQSDVFLLKRIRYVDDDAVSIEESWVPAQLIRSTMRLAFRCMTIFAVRIFSRSVRTRVSARMPDSEFQAHIQMDEKIPVLVIKQVALDQQHGRLNTASATVVAIYTSLCARSSASRWAQSPPRWLTTQDATAFPSSTARPASIPPPARPVPPAWLSPAPMVSTTAAGNAGTSLFFTLIPRARLYHDAQSAGAEALLPLLTKAFPRVIQSVRRSAS
jgi:hypothetical protein